MRASRLNEYRLFLLSAGCFWMLLGWAGQAAALPWDYDQSDHPSLQAWEVARNPVEGTVPVGREPFVMTYDEAGSNLRNPLPFSRETVWRGRRLWRSNCHTCHGATGDGAGPVGPLMLVPSLLSDFYKSRADGRIFAVIHLGQNNMPRYGYKFSDDEKWALVHYLRFLQGRDVRGMQRPAQAK